MEDKLARKSSSTTMSYFMKLNDWNYGFEGKKRKADSVFLNPEEIIQSKASNQISSALTPPAINILIPNNVQGSLPKREALQQRHLVPSIKNNFYESQREFPHNTQLSSHYSALKSS